MLFDVIFRRKFILIHTALTDEECMKIKGKLTDSGIYHEKKNVEFMLHQQKRLAGDVSNHNMTSM